MISMTSHNAFPRATVRDRALRLRRRVTVVVSDGSYAAAVRSWAASAPTCAS